MLVLRLSFTLNPYGFSNECVVLLPQAVRHRNHTQLLNQRASNQPSSDGLQPTSDGILLAEGDTPLACRWRY